MVCSVVNTKEAARERKVKNGGGEGLQERGRKKHSIMSLVPLHFFRALTASRVLYNRPEHSQGFYHNAGKNGTEGKRLQFSLKKT